MHYHGRLTNQPARQPLKSGRPCDVNFAKVHIMRAS